MSSQRFRAAAFIDLDRTLIGEASGPLLSAALRKAGVVSGSRLPGEDMLYRVFNLVGETLPSMVLARQGAAVTNLARGRRFGGRAASQRGARCVVS